MLLYYKIRTYYMYINDGFGVRIMGEIKDFSAIERCVKLCEVHRHNECAQSRNDRLATNSKACVRT